MKIPIKSNEQKYFRQVLEFLSPLTPFDQITTREKDVLAMLLYHNYRLGDLPKEERDALVFSKATREKIRKSLIITKPSFDNQLAALRRKGFITYSSIVPKFEIKNIDSELVLSFVIQ